jgi:hypothetical protein
MTASGDRHRKDHESESEEQVPAFHNKSPSTVLTGTPKLAKLPATYDA